MDPTFKDFVLSLGYEHFDRMTLHRCLDASPIFFELFLIDGFSSREYNVCRHDRSASLLIDYPETSTDWVKQSWIVILWIVHSLTDRPHLHFL
jgi:hypothetical protein